MKYLCIVHAEGSAFENLNDEEKKTLDRDSLAYDQSLLARKQMIHAEALQSPDTGVLVRVRHGAMSMTDGPFSEAKEQMCGFILIEARDMTEAVNIAGGIPMARLGTIEVRPIYNFGTPEG
jgi:hypothetical protein